MAKLTLAAAPTFKTNVMIPLPGKKPTPVEFVFKGRTRNQFREFVEGLADREDVDVILDIASGWDLEDPFSKESVELLVQNYLGAAKAVIEKYLTELTGARLGN